VQVKGASLENGLLHINLVREIPEAMKPRAIPIVSSSKVLEVQPTKLAA
jgi:molecular chaperone IbpA